MSILTKLIILLVVKAIYLNAQTIGSLLQNPSCMVDDQLRMFSEQIIDAFLEKDCCEFTESESVINYSQLYQTEKLKFSYYYLMDRTTYREFEKYSADTGQRVNALYGFITLPYYFYYKQLIEVNAMCEIKSIAPYLTENYTTCYLCRGNYFVLKPEDVQKFMVNPRVKEKRLDDKSVLHYIEGGRNLIYDQIFWFQRQWNCNNPNDQIPITGKFDSATSEKLLKTQVTGFMFSCDSCETKFCALCQKIKATKETKKSEKCLLCKDGYELYGGDTAKLQKFKTEKCYQCKINYCAVCTFKENEASKELAPECFKCVDGYFFFLQSCMDKCPEHHVKAKTTCVKCGDGQYVDIENDTCGFCAPKCRKCTGPRTDECTECETSYLIETERNDENGEPIYECLPIPEGSPCNIFICEDGYKDTKFPFKCKQCHESCDKCKGPSQTDCINCKKDFELVSGTCQKPQQKSQIFSADERGIVFQCYFACVNCNSKNMYQCTECKQDFLYRLKRLDGDLVYYECYNICPEGYEAKGEKDNEQQGQLDCQLIENKPPPPPPPKECLDGTYLDENTDQCVSCMQNCIQCSSSDECRKCALGFIYSEENKMCFTCDQSCFTCSGPDPNQCLKCRDPDHVLEKGVCRKPNPKKEPNPAPPKPKDIYQIQTKVFYGCHQKVEYAKLELVQQSQCTKQKFQKVYKKDNYKSCIFDYQVSKIPNSYAGCQHCINASLLNDLKAQLVIDQKNAASSPQNLLTYITQKNDANQYFMVNYVRRVTNTGCSAFCCDVQVFTSFANLPTMDGARASLHLLFKLDTRISGCQDFRFDNHYLDNMRFPKFKQYLQNAINSLDTLQKQYIVLNVCGFDKAKQQQNIPVLVQEVTKDEKDPQNYIFKVLNPRIQDKNNLETLNLKGSFNCKDCLYWEKYRIQFIEFYESEVIYENKLKQKEAEQKQKEEKLKEEKEKQQKEQEQKEKEKKEKEQKQNELQQKKNEPAEPENKAPKQLPEDAAPAKQQPFVPKCQCKPLLQFILNLEGYEKVPNYIRTITDQNQNKIKYLFFPYIKYDVPQQELLKSLDIKVNKKQEEGSAPFTDVEATKFIERYLKQLYDSNDRIYKFQTLDVPLCISNVLLDYQFVNGGVRMDDGNDEYIRVLKNKKYDVILTDLEKSAICIQEQYKERCKKWQQYGKACLAK